MTDVTVEITEAPVAVSVAITEAPVSVTIEAIQGVTVEELGGYFNKSTDDLDDLTEGTTNKAFTATLKSKLD